MPYVVDASVVAKWFVTEPDTAEALTLLQSGEPLFAPEFLLGEVANVFWKKCRIGLLSPHDAVRRLTELPDYLNRLPKQPSLAHVFSISVMLDHPIYDCQYLQAAIDTGFPLVTADTALLRKAERLPNLEIRRLSNWSAAPS